MHHYLSIPLLLNRHKISPSISFIYVLFMLCSWKHLYTRTETQMYKYMYYLCIYIHIMYFSYTHILYTLIFFKIYFCL